MIYELRRKEGKIKEQLHNGENRSSTEIISVETSTKFHLEMTEFGHFIEALKVIYC